MRNVVRFIVIALLTFIITWGTTGCALQKTVHGYRMDYCRATSDSFTKAVALNAIRIYLPIYPEDGICIGYDDRWYGEGFYTYQENK